MPQIRKVGYERRHSSGVHTAGAGHGEVRQVPEGSHQQLRTGYCDLETDNRG